MLRSGHLHPCWGRLQGLLRGAADSSCANWAVGYVKRSTFAVCKGEDMCRVSVVNPQTRLRCFTSEVSSCTSFGTLIAEPAVALQDQAVPGGLRLALWPLRQCDARTNTHHPKPKHQISQSRGLRFLCEENTVLQRKLLSSPSSHYMTSFRSDRRKVGGRESVEPCKGFKSCSGMRRAIVEICQRLAHHARMHAGALRMWPFENPQVSSPNGRRLGSNKGIRGIFMLGMSRRFDGFRSVFVAIQLKARWISRPTSFSSFRQQKAMPRRPLMALGLLVLALVPIHV